MIKLVGYTKDDFGHTEVLEITVPSMDKSVLLDALLDEGIDVTEEDKLHITDNTIGVTHYRFDGTNMGETYLAISSAAMDSTPDTIMVSNTRKEKMKSFICFTDVDGSGEYKTVSFDINSLVAAYGGKTTIASVPELFPILGYKEGDKSITIKHVESLYSPDDEEVALTTLGELADELNNLSDGVAASVGNYEDVFFLIPIN